MLQLVWEAFEDAGIAPSSLSGKAVGVYVGASSMDYSHRQFFDPAGTDSYLMTGNTLSLVSNRISYILNFTGPSLTIDTACSSSLVALDYALKDLRSGEIEIAVVGGVNCLLSPFNFMGFCAASMLSPDGLCRPFDHRANGYVRSEGGVAILLQRQNACDDLRGYPEIIACGMNSDGRTAGVALPSASQQSALLRQIYEDNGTNPDELAFVEAHGTGTLVGDPAEAGAIGEALAKRRSKPLPIGSAKSNVGHLEPASGLVGLLKAILALEHGQLPATLHVEKLNPYIPFSDLNLDVAIRPIGLEGEAGTRLLAGINNFGFGGTNVHALVSAAIGGATSPRRVMPSAEPPVVIAADSPASPVTMLLSAQNKTALHALAAAYADLLKVSSDDLAAPRFTEIARASVHNRELMNERLFAVADSPSAMADTLKAVAHGNTVGPALVGTAAARRASTVFVFSGNGSQWPGMGQHAFRSSERFRTHFRHIDRAHRKVADGNLEQMLFATDLSERLSRAELAQPLLFAVQVAMANSLIDQGLRPAAVLGHSVGEVAAAHVSGALDLETAVSVVRARSRFQELTYGSGRMAAIQMSRDDVCELIASHGLQDVEVAAVNSHRSVSVAGSAPTVEEIVRIARTRRAAAAVLDIEYPFHSEFMAPVRAPLLDVLSEQRGRAERLRFYSTVTGGAVGGEALDADYWWRNVRDPVAFDGAVRTAAADGCQVFIEIGPRPVLRGYLTDILGGLDTDVRVLATLDRAAESKRDAGDADLDEVTEAFG